MITQNLQRRSSFYNIHHAHSSRRLVLRLPPFGPFVNDIEIPTLLDYIKPGIESLLLVIVLQRHNTDIGVALDSLPQIAEAVHIVGMFHMRMFNLVLSDSMVILEPRPEPILLQSCQRNVCRLCEAKYALFPGSFWKMLTRQCSWWKTSRMPA